MDPIHDRLGCDATICFFKCAEAYHDFASMVHLSNLAATSSTCKSRWFAAIVHAEALDATDRERKAGFYLR